MPLLLSTPYNPGEFDTAQYAMVRIVEFTLQSVNKRIVLRAHHGNVVASAWRDGVLLEGKTARTFAVVNRQNPAWQPSNGHTVGAVASNGGNTYVCVGAGTSDAAGGPTGSGSAIADGTVTWRYNGPEADYDEMLNALPLSGAEKIYNGAARCLYQWLIDRGYYNGTIV